MSYYKRRYFFVDNPVKETFVNPNNFNPAIPFLRTLKQDLEQEVGPIGANVIDHVLGRIPGHTLAGTETVTDNLGTPIITEKAEAEARAKAEAREKVDAEARAKARAEAKTRAEAEAKAKLAAKTKAEAKAKAKALAKAKEKKPLFRSDIIQRRDAPSNVKWGYNCNAKNSVCVKDWPTLKGYVKNECGNTKDQSPVRLSTPNNFPNFSINYQVTNNRGKVLNLGPLIRIECVGNNSIVVDGDRYLLRFIDLHTPSEHLISSDDYDLEFQLVHLPEKKAKSSHVIISLLIDSDDRMNGALPKRNIWDVINGGQTFVIPKDSSPTISKQNQLNLQKLHREVIAHPNSRYYHYTGSLTIPPCTSNVKWIVVIPPFHCFKFDQNLKSIVGQNNRGLNPKR